MDYLIVGLNHEKSPVELRERFAIGVEKVPGILGRLKQLPEIGESLVLSTCNRVEVYGATSSPVEALNSLIHFLSDLGRVSEQVLRLHLYHYQREEAVIHAMRVAASLDSMVLGEPQILSQVKEAFYLALDQGALGTYLNRLMHRVLAVAKMVREETKIGKGSVSIGSVAVGMAQRIFGHLSEKSLCLLGAGEMGELILKHLRQEGVAQIRIMNRTFDKAKALEEKGWGQAIPIEKRNEALAEADVVITSMSGEMPQLTFLEFTHLMHARKNKPLFLIDLGVPRNIESSVQKLTNVYLYNIDDLKKVSSENQMARQEEAKKAEILVQKEASSFYSTVLNQYPTIAQLNQKFEQIRLSALEKTFRGREGLTDEEKEAWEACTRSIVGQILKDPILHLKTLAPTEEKKASHDLLKKLFRLEDE